jgi:phosphinothricin acetyltransferase
VASRAILRAATLADADAIRAIYNYEVVHTTATMDLVPRTRDEQEAWIADRSGAFATLVAEEGGVIAGFAALSPYRHRAAYRTTVEDSVYVHRDHHGRGLGRLLLEGILDAATAGGFHVVIARIEASGDVSRRLHESCGFTLVGVEMQTARKFNRWRDIAVLQCLLHHRHHDLESRFR